MKITPNSKVLLATTNKGKVAELTDLLKDYAIQVLSLDDCSVTGEAEETGDTFTQNAIIKAEYGMKQTGLICIADDSGLEVKALAGRPGIFSSRFAGNDYYAAMKKLYDEAEKLGDLSARFVCVIAVAFPDAPSISFFGEVRGKLCWPPIEGQGFGYDPFFVPDGYDSPFSVLGKDIKQKISHRYNALALFAQECLSFDEQK